MELFPHKIWTRALVALFSKETFSTNSHKGQLPSNYFFIPNSPLRDTGIYHQKAEADIEFAFENDTIEEE